MESGAARVPRTVAFFGANGSAQEKHVTPIGARRRCKVRHYTGVRGHADDVRSTRALALTKK